MVMLTGYHQSPRFANDLSPFAGQSEKGKKTTPATLSLLSPGA
jgi:hypothetical protein